MIWRNLFILRITYMGSPTYAVSLPWIPLLQFWVYVQAKTTDTQQSLFLLKFRIFKEGQTSLGYFWPIYQHTFGTVSSLSIPNICFGFGFEFGPSVLGDFWVSRTTPTVLLMPISHKSQNKLFCYTLINVGSSLCLSEKQGFFLLLYKCHIWLQTREL